MSAEPCKSIGLLLGAHLDGQLDTVKTLEVEEHLASCEVCRERLALDRALRGSLKKAVKTSAPSDVRARMLAAMAGETARQERASDSELEPKARPDLLEAVAKHDELDASPMSTAAPSKRESRPTMLRSWRTMLPLASAAALVMGWGFASKQPVVRGMPDTVVTGGGDYLRDFVSNHKRPLPPEQADPNKVAQFERTVGVPVQPVKYQNARFVGARLLPLHDSDTTAVVMQYEIQQGQQVQRVTMYVYDPSKVQVGRQLAPRTVGTSEVRVGESGGYFVGVGQRRGVGYAAASDDPEASAKLVAAATDGD